MNRVTVVVNELKAQQNSRMTAIALTLFTLRSMEHWKEWGGDFDRAMILVAVVAIKSERLLRTDVGPEERTLSLPIGRDRLARCNISSLASATGLNRETARRKVMSLVEQGLLVRLEDGSIDLSPGFSQEERAQRLVRRQLDGVVRFANEIARMGVIETG